MKILVLDDLHQAGIDVFMREGFQIDSKSKINTTELTELINNYDAIVVRGATKISSEILNLASRLKVIGRAGSGVDNINIIAATKKGVVVMNTPGGNTITTAEHALALMFSLARQVPQASASMKDGKWEKSFFIGTELTNKILGIIGLGNIGKIVAERAIGLKMVVLAYDPYISKEDAIKFGVELVSLDEIYARCDFITYHTPLTPETRGIINIQAINKMKKGVFLINCARGELINESDLLAALESNHVKGVALDVFSMEPPPRDLPLLKHPNVILTPHLGASTIEAQEKVAILIAEQISDFLKYGTIRNSVNFPPITSEMLPILRPYLTLCERLGSFRGQLLSSPLKELRIEYLGEVSKLMTEPLTISVLKGLLQHQTEDVNLVNARMVAEERGIKVSETKTTKTENYTSLIRVISILNNEEASISGVIFGNNPKVIKVNHFPIEADLSGGILMLENLDVPGVIGRVGTFLGDKGINIASFQLGRNKPGGTAISLINVDNIVSDKVITELVMLPNVNFAKYLIFPS
ncbi:MAG: phosphoglycerate dehydrogenase [Candidatus Lokiarchaeota archaeon]|nr:phosphoglycerate dehydrogenase [Candidatus Lokiarchaeota archaeon]